MTSATRIVAIQSRLASEHLPVSERFRLVEEQRRLWDSEFLGRSFENIEREAKMDEWMVRRV